MAARSGARGAARSLPEGIGARIAAPLVGQRPVIFAPTRHSVNLGGITSLLKLLKLFKLLRLTRLAKKLERIAAAKAFRVLQFVLMLMMFAHW